MNIPITSRVKRAGKKGCGCGCDCQCGKTPAKFNAGLRKAYKGGKLNPELEAAMEAKDPQTPAKQTMYDNVKRGARRIAGRVADAAVDATAGPAIRAIEGFANKSRKNNQTSNRLPSFVSHRNDNNRVTPATPRGKQELIGPKNKAMTKTVSRKPQKQKPVNTITPRGAVSMGSNALSQPAPKIKKQASTAKPISKREALKLNRQQKRAIKATPAKMWGAAKVAHGAKAVAKNYKKGYYGK